MMHKVGTLLEKLQRQYNEGATPGQMMLTTQLIRHELMQLQDFENDKNDPVIKKHEEHAVIVHEPEKVVEEPVNQPEIQPEKQEAEEEKVIEVLQVDDAEIEAELEEIKKNAAAIQQISVQSKPENLFQDLKSDDELPPTLAAHPLPSDSIIKEINDSIVSQEINSLNEKHKNSNRELSEKLTESGIKDLKKAIGINDRFVFINELFRGDEAMYERSIKTINSFTIYPEAEYWIRRELKTKLGWDNSLEVVHQFDRLVKRRFL
jgi:DNA-binding transcriptional MerR regulator